MDENIDFNDIRTPAQFKQQHPHLFEGKGAPSLDYLMRTADINGLSECGAVIELAARRRMIVVPRFLKWMLSRYEAA